MSNKNNQELSRVASRAVSKFPWLAKLIIAIAIVITAWLFPDLFSKVSQNSHPIVSTGYQLAASDGTYSVVNDNNPSFTSAEISTDGHIDLSELDSLKRCGTALACIGPETLPTKKRGDIGSVKPTGWHTVKYPGLIKDVYLYNRCHLIGYQMCGLNAEKRNLITGTRQMNVAMIPFEDDITDYVKETGNHVMYRVTPKFEGNELIARGVDMEAMSVEDEGEGISFHVYIPNEQNGISIDYGNGDSVVTETGEPGTERW